MSENTERPWWEVEANKGIVGLGVGPDADEPGGIVWPTEGYDGSLTDWHRRAEHGYSGRPREDWVALADAMIARWTAWRAQVEALPDHVFRGDADA